MYEYIVVGSGFAGTTIANLIAARFNKKVMVIEKRSHIGGNCYDYKWNNIFIHKYGPHLFHTDHEDVFNYLSQFTEWIPYEHRVLGKINDKMVPIPFNFKSIQMIFDKETSQRLIKKLLDTYPINSKISILELKKTNDPELKMLAEYIYQNVFLGYTKKQWGKAPEEIDPSITSRVPIIIGWDDRYFQDKYQVMPKNGFTYIFKKMLNNSNINLVKNTDAKKILKIDFDKEKIYVKNKIYNGKLIYTGKLDELCEYKFGPLPYRSLNFKFVVKKVKFFQKTTTVNYPNDYKFTRISEFKHIYKNNIPKTMIVYEYPVDYNGKNIPYYPINFGNAKDIYEMYNKYIKNIDNVILLGRLAEYKYYDMDDVIKKSLEIFHHL